MLESMLYEHCAFIGLSYRDEDLSKNVDGVPSLDPRHARGFVNSLRTRIYPERFRYFLVGEYGGETERPHLHVVLYGFRTCLRGGTLRYVNTDRPNAAACCERCKLIYDVWGKGDVDLGTVTERSIHYVVGYTIKKMTGKDDFRLDGRHPEFHRQSNRPGIGFSAMSAVRDTMLAQGLHKTEIDVPSQLTFGTRTFPLARYLRNALREMLGREKRSRIEEMINEEVKKGMAVPGGRYEMGALRLPETERLQALYRMRQENAVPQESEEVKKQKRLNIRARNDIIKQRKEKL